MDPESALKVALLTLGCKTNQSDAASLAAELSARGHRIVSSPREAEVAIIYTCTVTQKTDYQSRQLIRRVKTQNPAARVMVTGCYAQVSPQSLREIGGIDFIVGVGEQGKIPEILVSGKSSSQTSLLFSEIGERRVFEPGRLPLFTERTRAYLKIQDGCNSFCSYCIVPHARGRNRSLPPEGVLSRVRDLSARGVREVVLTGIHLGTYGEDFSPPLSLAQLLRLLEREGLPPRLRLSSIEPGEFSPDLIEVLAGSVKICPHLHIPLQSGDDEILRRMNRNYTASFFEDLVTRLIPAVPGLAIGADVIVGFPGEGEENFGPTVSLIERLPLAYLHVFPFSRRRGTPAAGFPEQVPSPTIRARCQILRELGEKKRSLFYRSFLGQKLTVLVESKRDPQSGMLKGYSQNYIPVLLEGDERLVNQEVEVRILEIRDGKAFGKTI